MKAQNSHNAMKHAKKLRMHSHETCQFGEVVRFSCRRLTRAGAFSEVVWLHGTLLSHNSIRVDQGDCERFVSEGDCHASRSTCSSLVGFICVDTCTVFAIGSLWMVMASLVCLIVLWAFFFFWCSGEAVAPSWLRCLVDGAGVASVEWSRGVGSQ